jgi:hypothetical protein
MKISVFSLLFLVNSFGSIVAQTLGDSHFFDLSYSGLSGNAKVIAKSNFISAVGLAYTYETKGNIVFELQYRFLFGNYSGPDLFSALRTTQGLLIAVDGSLTDVSVLYRGNSFYFNVGKNWPLVARHNLQFLLGVGLYQDLFLLRSLGATLPFLVNGMDKGYDQLSAGPSFQQALRYRHLGAQKRINYSIDVFVQQAFLSNLRKYNYFNHTADDAQHFNLIFGLQFAWIIPAFTTFGEEEFYTN